MTADLPNKGATIATFPLIRHLSTRMTPILAKTPVTPNQITAASLLFGLGAAACVTVGDYRYDLVGSALLLIAYTLDNCDGEIARLKSASSAFGEQFDTFVDWIVHAAFFACLVPRRREPVGAADVDLARPRRGGGGEHQLFYRARILSPQDGEAP